MMAGRKLVVEGTTNVPREWGSLLGLRCEQVDQHFEVAR